MSKIASPSIIIGQTDAERLTALADKIAPDQPTVADLLLGELDRAEIREDGRVPASTIAMNSLVEFVDEAHGTLRSVQLVYPRQADIAQNRISVLTPVGAGLIGLSEGQAILWPDRDGRQRRLRILSVRRCGA